MLGRNRQVYFDCATGKFDSAQARMCGMCKQKETCKIFKYNAQNVWQRSTENTGQLQNCENIPVLMGYLGLWYVIKYIIYRPRRRDSPCIIVPMYYDLTTL